MGGLNWSCVLSHSLAKLLNTLWHKIVVIVYLFISDVFWWKLLLIIMKKKIWVPSNWWKSKPARWPFCISVYDGAFYYICFIETKPTKTHYFLYKSLVKLKKIVSKNDQTTTTTFYLGFNINYMCNC